MIPTTIRTREEETQCFNVALCDILQKNGLGFMDVLDVAIGPRVISFRFDEKRYARYYLRYGMLIEYVYRTSPMEGEQNLSDINCYKADANGKLLERNEYIRYWKTMLCDYLPQYFADCGVPYRVIYVQCRPPFEDEDLDIIRQQTNIPDSSENLPVFPRAHYMLIRVNGVDYVCKQTGQLKIVYFPNLREDELPATMDANKRKGLVAIRKDQFFINWGCFEPMDWILTGHSAYKLKAKNDAIPPMIKHRAPSRPRPFPCLTISIPVVEGREEVADSQ